MTLLDFAESDRQREVVKLRETMSFGQIAKKLGIHKAGVHRTYQRVKRKAEKRGWSPEHDMTKVCPETHFVKGTSTLYGEDGQQKLQWVKTQADMDRLKETAEAIAAGVAECVPAKRRTKQPKAKVSDKLAVYPIGDQHTGLHCWQGDSEENWDLKLATEVIRSATAAVMEATPETEEALIVNLGDWVHSDTQENKTRRSGHQLDVDTRWAKVLEVAAANLIYVVDYALLKHKRVTVINEVGNHDDHTSVMLAMLIQAHYRSEPRVAVDTSPDGFHWYEFGNNLIGVHHGHKCKPADLYRVMAEDQREACGRCKHRYWYLGHVHHARKIDIGEQVVESFRTLIPKDAYAHSEGYRAPRDICSIVLDREHGECFRATVNVEACR